MQDYEVIALEQASYGGEKKNIGEKGSCRYCGNSNKAMFKKVAHTFPESLGNKWVFSLDECDQCNSKFSCYEDALSKGVAPFLTLGAFAGKKNKTRQTGRTKGSSVLQHTGRGGNRHISISLKDTIIEDHVFIDQKTGNVKLVAPVAGVPFKPRYAYKALAKMAFALLPSSEQNNFQDLRQWLINIDDDSKCLGLDVGFSFSSVGNAPDLVCGALLRPKKLKDIAPHILFFFCAGSLCLQICLRADDKENSIQARPLPISNIRWCNILGPKGCKPIKIDYGEPFHLDWSSSENEPQPIESVEFNYCSATQLCSVTPKFRD